MEKIQVIQPTKLLAPYIKPLSEDEFKQTLAAWWGWAKYSDSEYLINKLNKITPYEIKFRR